MKRLFKRLIQRFMDVDTDKINYQNGRLIIGLYR